MQIIKLTINQVIYLNILKMISLTNTMQKHQMKL